MSRPINQRTIIIPNGEKVAANSLRLRTNQTIRNVSRLPTDEGNNSVHARLSRYPRAATGSVIRGIA